MTEQIPPPAYEFIKGPDGNWRCSLHEGMIIVKLGTQFNPHQVTEYERLTLDALATDRGGQQFLESLETGPEVQIADHWFAWGVASPITQDGTWTGVEFDLMRFAI